MSTAPTVDVATTHAEPRWGMGQAVIGWLVAYSASSLFTVLVLVPSFGYSADDIDAKRYSLAFLALGYPPLWLGFVGAPVWAAATRGAGVVKDFGLRVRAIDLPVGAASGVAAQFLLVPAVSVPIFWLTNTDLDKLSEPARELGAKANTPGGVLLMFLIVGIGAPIAEELFFRGLVLRTMEKRFGTAWAVVGSSVVFGATHFQPLQFPALTAVGAVFALLAVRTGRLGPAIAAHMAFNTATVIVLVWFT